MSNTYNGWTNYATWRVNLEIFDGGNFDRYSANDLKEYAEDILWQETDGNGLAYSYAMSFLSDVNWYEIADAFQEENEE